MEFIFELLFEIFGELILQVLFQVLAEVGLQSLRAPFQKESNPWLAALGYILMGAMVGGISLLVFPVLHIQTHKIRVLNLALSPLAAGAAMAALGAWRRHRDQPVLRIDKFTYGFVFALSMALVRFSFGRYE